MNRLRQYFANSFRPRDRRPTPEWARENVSLVTPLTKTGPFDVSSSRHFIAPIEAVDDERTREENIMAPIRSGKTLIADVLSMEIICRRPGPLLWVFQDDKAARDQAELRTWRLIRANKNISDMLPEDRHKQRGQEIIFPHMPFHIKGPAISNLQSRGYQYVFLDEVRLYKGGRLEEARGRLGDYVRLGIDKLLCISQGGEPGDDWERQFNNGVIHEWHVQCAGCGKYCMPRWTGHRPDGSRWGMLWDPHKLPSGLWDIPKCVATTRFECEHCGHPHIDCARTKSEWNRTGMYIAEQTDKNPKRKSHHWTAIIDFPWESLVEEFLSAVNAHKIGATEQLVIFFQKRMAEQKNESALLENTMNFRSSSYDLKSEWPDAAFRCLTADRQAEDVYWVTVREWAKTGKSRRLWFGKLFSAVEIEEKRKEFNVDPKRTFIDSGFNPKGDHGVYSDCIRFGWVPVKGTGVGPNDGEAVSFKHRIKVGKDYRVVERSYAEPVWVDPEIGKPGQGRRRVQMIRFSAPTYADRVKNLIDRGLWLEPDVADKSDPMELEYRRQMESEYKKAKVEKFSGHKRFFWVCPSGNNHAFDCAKMQVLVATILRVLPDLDVTDSPKENQAETQNG